VLGRVSFNRGSRSVSKQASKFYYESKRKQISIYNEDIVHSYRTITNFSVEDEKHADAFALCGWLSEGPSNACSTVMSCMVVCGVHALALSSFPNSPDELMRAVMRKRTMLAAWTQIACPRTKTHSSPHFRATKRRGMDSLRDNEDTCVSKCAW